MRFLFAVVCVLLVSTEAYATRTISGHETWAEKVVLDESVHVPEGAILTLLPGTEVYLPPGAAIDVTGHLVLKGTRERPIFLRLRNDVGKGFWQGISIHSAAQNIELEHCQLADASLGLSVSESSVRIAHSRLERGAKGVVAGLGARVLVEDVIVREMSEGAIEASVRSQVRVIGCTIEKVSGFGVSAAQQAVVLIRDNRISDTKFGILASGDFPALEGNVLRDCELGIGVVQASPNSIVRRNRVIRAKIGIDCRQFAAPTIEFNVIEECENGINCFQGASPLIRQNRLARNRRALSCIQMCNPVVTWNDFSDNEAAAYLHLSSYARFRDNNFEGNKLHIELDNMSYDWEVRAGMKPMRNRDKQREVFMQSGRAAPVNSSGIEVKSEGFVDAKANYWGEETTREMEEKGPDANISAFQDAFDVPTRSYEGWPGEYLQDRIRYDDWKKTRVLAAGPGSSS